MLHICLVNGIIFGVPVYYEAYLAISHAQHSQLLLSENVLCGLRLGYVFNFQRSELVQDVTHPSIISLFHLRELGASILIIRLLVGTGPLLHCGTCHCKEASLRNHYFVLSVAGKSACLVLSLSFSLLCCIPSGLFSCSRGGRLCPAQ